MHSGLRYVVLLLLVTAIVRALIGKRGKYGFNGLRKIALFTMIATHLQLVIGLALYFLKNWHLAFTVQGFMKNPHTRFFAVEHLSVMLIAIAIITFGYSSAKRMQNVTKQHLRILITFLIGFVLIMASIPWPFRTDLGYFGWF